jgi:hypothetical protein
MIYLREQGGQYVGPFRSRKDAERFIGLMQLCGENWADTEIVRSIIDPAAGRQIASSDRNRQESWQRAATRSLINFVGNFRSEQHPCGLQGIRGLQGPTGRYA